MKLLSTLITMCAGAKSVLAYPGMDKLLTEIQNKAARQENGATPNPGLDSTELIGDLVNLTDAQLTPVGQSVKQIITGQETGQSSATYPNIPSKDTPSCAADTCCIWHYIADDMAAQFRGPSGRCTDLARQAVRFGFHDSAGWSNSTGPLGGADGSIVLAPEEMTRPANLGLENITAQMKEWFSTYQPYRVSMADLIQMGATTAAVVCPLGPRVRSFVGRRDSSVPATDGLLPSPFAGADDLIELFQNKTIQPNGLASLLGAHTTSQQRFVNVSRAGDPQDSTPGVWDVLYYNQTLDPNAPPRVFKFPSDINLSQDPRTGPLFEAFAGPGGQLPWNEAFAREYVRLSLLGVFNINNLTECTKVLPPAETAAFNPPDLALEKTWAGTTRTSYPVAQALMDGELLSNLSSLIGGLGTST